MENVAKIVGLALGFLNVCILEINQFFSFQTFTFSQRIN